MSLPGFAFASPFILWQGEEGGGCNICLYLAFHVSLHSSYHKVQNTVVSESVELLLNRSF